MKLANKPKFKKYTFAQDANADTIEEVPDTQTPTKEANGYIGYQYGYTIYNMKPLIDGGKPPRGQQLNQVLNDITSVTQYATMGGTYDLNESISSETGYPKNALITNDTGIFRSLQDDNKVTNLADTNAWQQVVSFEKHMTRTVGSLFYAVSNKTRLNGALLCNGDEYSLLDFPDLKKYLDNGTLYYKSLLEWKSDYEINEGQVGYFGYDPDFFDLEFPNLCTFRVPCINSGRFLSSIDSEGHKIHPHTPYVTTPGTYLYQGFPNIQGSFYFMTMDEKLTDKAYSAYGRGAFSLSTYKPGKQFNIPTLNNNPDARPADVIYNEFTFNLHEGFKAWEQENYKYREVKNLSSKANIILPQTICEGLYVVVSEN